MNTYGFCIFSVLICFSLAVPVKETPRKAKNRSRLIPKKFKNSSSCDPWGICDNAVSYPIKTIQKLVKRKKNLPLFSNVSLIEPAEDVSGPQVRASQELDNLCRTKTLTIAPKVGYDFHSGERRFIVNIRDLVQTVVYEICAEPNRSCIDSKLLPYEYHTRCTQKFNIVRLVSVSDEGKVEYGKFKVPSTCVCSQLKPVSNDIMPFL